MLNKLKIGLGLSLCLLLTAIAASVSAATIEHAMIAYQDGKFAEAHQQLVELAALGNKTAQYSIGAMYVRGEGVEKNRLEGIAWIWLASSSGDAEMLSVKDKLFQRLTEAERQQVASRHEALLLEYGDAAVEQKLYPNLNPKNVGAFRDRSPLRRVSPEYPKAAIKEGLLGNVTLTYIIGKDGRTRFHRVDSYTNKVFIKPAVEAIKEFLYEPAKINGQPVDVFGNSMRFSFNMDGKLNEKPLVKALEDLREKAASGTSSDKYAYAHNASMARTFLSEASREKFADVLHWQNLAAKDGFPAAKYELGSRLMYGEQCDSDMGKSLFWLQQAAEDGFLDAQLYYGIERYNGVSFAKDEAEGLRWIKRAADKEFDLARVYYVMLTALGSDSTRAQLEEAETMLRAVDKKKFYDELSYFEIDAALMSRLGKHSAAIKQQKAALKEAEKYRLDTKLLQENLNLLEQKKRIERII